MFITTSIARRVLRVPDGEPGGDNGAAVLEAPAGIETGTLSQAEMQKRLDIMFPEDRAVAAPPAVNGERPGETTDESASAEATTPDGVPDGSGTGGGDGTGAGQPEGQPEEGQPERGEGQPAPGDPVYKKMMGRFGKLLGEIENLREENEQLRTRAGSEPAAAVPDSVGRITKLDDLQKLQGTTKSMLKTVESYFRQLGFNAKGVEKAMRAYAASNPKLAERFKNAEGEDDYSTEKMAEVLTEMEGNLTDTLEAIPARQQLITHRAGVSQLMREPELLAVAPFVRDVESEENGKIRELMKLSPDLRNAPNGEYLAVACVLGQRILDAAIGKVVARKGGQPAKGGSAAGPGTLNVNGRGPSRMPVIPSSGGAKRGGGNLKQAREAFNKAPTMENLNKALESL